MAETMEAADCVRGAHAEFPESRPDPLYTRWAPAVCRVDHQAHYLDGSGLPVLSNSSPARTR